MRKTRRIQKQRARKLIYLSRKKKYDAFLDRIKNFSNYLYFLSTNINKAVERLIKSPFINTFKKISKISNNVFETIGRGIKHG